MNNKNESKKAYKEKNSKFLQFELYKKDWDLYDKFISILDKTKNAKLRKLFNLAEKQTMNIIPDNDKNELVFHYMNGDLGSSKGSIITCKKIDIDDVRNSLKYLTQNKKTWGSESDYDESRQGKDLKIFMDEYDMIHIENETVDILMSKREAEKLLEKM